MDGFTDNFVGENAEADFLAREKDQLAGLEDDIAPEVTVTDDITEDIAASPVADNQNGLADLTGSNDELNSLDKDTEAEETFDIGKSDDFGLTEDSESQGQYAESGDLFGHQPEASFPIYDQDLEVAALEEPKEIKPTYNISPVTVREEPEKIKLWREEQRRRLEEKDEKEEKAKEELRERGSKELAEWYKQHEDQVSKTRQTNRSAEKELVADMTQMEPGTEWERIAKLCDFNPKTSKSSRDISRMRSIILQVKQNPPIKSS